MSTFCRSGVENGKALEPIFEEKANFDVVKPKNRVGAKIWQQVKRISIR